MMFISPSTSRAPTASRAWRELRRRSRVLERVQAVPAPLDEAFAFFADPLNLEAITPPWLRFRIVSAPSRLDRGSRLSYRLRLFGAPVRWLTEITAWAPPRGFTDVQLEGPYRLWEHAHRLTPVPGGTEIRDLVRYRLPLEPLASPVAPATVERWLDAIFDYRARAVAELLRGEPAAFDP
jgi:ligand-binding SRPBCC domain-containing protein